MLIFLLYLYAGLCLFLSKRRIIMKEGWAWSLGWFIIFSMFWPFYPVLSYFDLDG